jgi:hypothetical protein
MEIQAIKVGQTHDRILFGNPQQNSHFIHNYQAVVKLAQSKFGQTCLPAGR